MRQVLCPVLVGRDDEARLLLDALDGAAGGHGGTWFVAGEAGVGKSRLAREVSGQAQARGMTVLTGRAVPGGVPVAFRPLAEAVMQGLRGRDVLDAPGLRPFRAALGRLVPQWQPDGSVTGDGSPVVLGEGLLRLLRTLAGERGCLVVLEDLHWADGESLAVLEYLADNVTAERVALLGTFRPEDDAAAGVPIARLAGRRAAHVVELRRLGDAETVRLARACLGADALPAGGEDLLVAGADGLPFLVEELLAGLVGDGVLAERDGRWSVSASGPLDRRVPPTFADAVHRRLAACPGRPPTSCAPRRSSAGASTGRCCPRSPVWRRATSSPRCDERSACSW
jgi:predicted ATPase